MRVLVACEESQAVCKAFRALGHEAYSCDIQDCSGGHPEWHIKADALELLKMRWDLIIAHPPCTYLANCGAPWLYLPDGSLNEDRINRGGDSGYLLPALFGCGLPQNLRGEPRPVCQMGAAKAHAVRPALPVRPPGYKADRAMAKGLAAAKADKRPGKAETAILHPQGRYTGHNVLGNAAARKQKQKQNIPRHRSSYGGAMGRGYPRHARKN